MRVKSNTESTGNNRAYCLEVLNKLSHIWPLDFLTFKCKCHSGLVIRDNGS